MATMFRSIALEIVDDLVIIADTADAFQRGLDVSARWAEHLPSQKRDHDLGAWPQMCSKGAA